MLTWQDGLEKAPDGAPVRELAQRDVSSSSVWISPVGDAWRRYYNQPAKTWAWERMPHALDAEQRRLGIHTAHGWLSVQNAIATAWLHRAPGSKAHVVITDPSRPIDVRNLRWGDEEEEDLELEDDNTWAPLDWHCGLAPCDARYQISPRGLLKSPDGRVTRGFYAHGTRWAAVRGAGLVDLYAAASSTVRVQLAPRLFAAYRALMDDVSVHDFAHRENLTVTTAWAYFAQVARYIPREKAKVHVAFDLWVLLLSLQRDPLHGGPLKPLHATLSAQLRRDVSFEELRFARANQNYSGARK